MTFLLDANVLIPLCFPEHLHHPSAVKWLRQNPNFAVCPITQGSLVRFLVRTFADGSQVAEVSLQRLAQMVGYEFWPDNLSFGSMSLSRVSGHNQVTDAYLVALAGTRNSKLATFDVALGAIHEDSVVIPLS